MNCATGRTRGWVRGPPRRWLARRVRGGQGRALPGAGWRVGRAAAKRKGLPRAGWRVGCAAASGQAEGPPRRWLARGAHGTCFAGIVRMAHAGRDPRAMPDDPSFPDTFGDVDVGRRDREGPDRFRPILPTRRPARRGRPAPAAGGGAGRADRPCPSRQLPGRVGRGARPEPAVRGGDGPLRLRAQPASARRLARAADAPARICSPFRGRRGEHDRRGRLSATSRAIRPGGHDGGGVRRTRGMAHRRHVRCRGSRNDVGF